MGEQRDPLTDLDAERGIIGSLLVNPEGIPEYGEIEPGLFSVRRNALVVESILSVYDAGLEVNHLSVAEHLRDHGRFGEVGAGYLMECDKVFARTPEGTAQQLARLRDLSTRRRWLATLMHGREQIFDLRKPAEEVMLLVSGDLAKLGHASVTGFRTAEEFLHRELEKIDATQAGTTEAQYVLTGIKLWDELLGGVPRGFLTIIAAQPGVGKSSMLATMARSLAEGDDERLPEEVAVFSLEDEGGWMPRRYLAEGADLSIRQLVKRGLEKDAIGRVHNVAAHIAHVLRRIHICDVRRMNVHRVAAAARQIIAKRGVRVIIVDHLLEMLDFSDQRSRDERIGEILSVLRDLAVECGVAVVLAAHLKDPDDSRVDARYIQPKLQDFAGGRFVDRMARVAVGLWFPPKPPEPKEGKPIAEPKRGARMKDDEWAAILEKYEAAKKKAGFDLERKRRDWEEKCTIIAETLVCTVLKANEGESGFDFTLRRVKHAGLISRTEGSRHPRELGYTPAAR